MLTKEEIDSLCDEYEFEDILLADGFEEAFIGFAQQFNNIFALYDRNLCTQLLVRQQGITEEEAEEYFDFNVTGAYVGPKTPAFVLGLGRNEDG